MIPAVQVSDLPLAAVFNRISDAVTGFNPLFQQQAPLYSVSPTFCQFDFTTASFNFCFGQVDPDQIEVTGDIKYPFACMYVLDSANTNEIKFTTFSGPVRVILDIYLSWGQIRGLPNFEKYVNCVESVVVSIANGLANQDWQKPLTYNGGVQCRRGPLMFAGENWRQKVGFSFLLLVDT